MTDELTLTDALLASPPPEPEPMHGGIIQVDSRIFASLGIDVRGCDTQGEFADTGVFADVKAKLLLPENYTIHFLLLRWQVSGYWEVGVTSPDLPPMNRYEQAPVLTPLCQRLADGTTRLLSIRIEDRWQRTYSPDEVTLERL